MTSSTNGLIRSLGLAPAIAVVVGSVLGTGVFLKSALMAQLVGSAWLVLLAWTLAGLLSLVGALVYAELGCRFPEAGGEYVYLREAFGGLSSFLFGWTRFWIISPGSIAAYAVGSSTFVAGVWLPGDPTTRLAVALGLIALFTAINCRTVAFSGAFQTGLTVLKALTIAGLAAGAMISARLPFEDPMGSGSVTSPAGFGAAILAALWAYDGWNNLASMAGELRRPQRDVPWALLLGMCLVMALYFAVNASYFFVLPLAEIQSASSTQYSGALPVATKAAATFLGPVAVRLLSLAFVLSAIGAMNGQILAGARVPYAMARDGLFFRWLGRVSAATHVPTCAVLAQSGIAAVLAASGSFDQLTDSVVFASWIFYGGATAALFRFRHVEHASVPAFRMPAYPLLPALFLMACALLVVNAVIVSPSQSALGLALIASGVPAYRIFRGRARRDATSHSEVR